MDSIQSLDPASVFVEWRAQAGLKVHELQELVQCASMCCHLYHVHLHECFFNQGGSRNICQFSAPDAESVRNALRTVNVKADSIWAGRVYQWRRRLPGNVIVERPLDGQWRSNAATILSQIDREWGQNHGIELARAVVSLDETRAFFVCHAADRATIDRAAVAMSREDGTAVWSCRLLTGAIS